MVCALGLSPPSIKGSQERGVPVSTHQPLRCNSYSLDLLPGINSKWILRYLRIVLRPPVSARKQVYTSGAEDRDTEETKKLNNWRQFPQFSDPEVGSLGKSSRKGLLWEASYFIYRPEEERKSVKGGKSVPALDKKSCEKTEETGQKW